MEPDPELGGLSELQKRLLDFERASWTHAGAKDEAIRTEFACTAARYYQLLNAALECPEVVAFDPLLVRRLQRLRHSRTTARSDRRLGTAHSTADFL